MAQELTTFGMQRSGTNFLEQCIRKNIQGPKIVNQWRKGVWKHIHRIDEKPEFDGIENPRRLVAGEYGGPKLMQRILDKNLRLVYIHKHPYNWLQSITNKSVDTMKTQPMMFHKNGPKSDEFFQFGQIDILKATRFWVDHVSWWYGVRNKMHERYGEDFTYFVSYENLIESEQNTIHHLKKMAERFQLTYMGKDIIPKNVGQSDPWTEKTRQRYTQMQLASFSWDHISEINKYIDKDLMKRLGYTLIESEREFLTHKVSPV